MGAEVLKGGRNPAEARPVFGSNKTDAADLMEMASNQALRFDVMNPVLIRRQLGRRFLAAFYPGIEQDAKRQNEDGEDYVPHVVSSPLRRETPGPDYLASLP